MTVPDLAHGGGAPLADVREVVHAGGASAVALGSMEAQIPGTDFNGRALFYCALLGLVITGLIGLRTRDDDVIEVRKLLDQLGNSIDAVTVSTPDHMHYPIAVAALQLGKHVFVEKPMAHTIAEGRRMAQVAREKGLRFEHGNRDAALDEPERGDEPDRAASDDEDLRFSVQYWNKEKLEWTKPKENGKFKADKEGVYPYYCTEQVASAGSNGSQLNWYTEWKPSSSTSYGGGPSAKAVTSDLKPRRLNNS